MHLPIPLSQAIGFGAPATDIQRAKKPEKFDGAQNGCLLYPTAAFCRNLTV